MYCNQKALIQVFLLHDNFCELPTLINKFKKLFCTQNLVLNGSFKDF